VSIDRLVQRLYTRTALLNLDTVFVYIIASRFFEQNDYEKLLVPGIARTSKGLSYAASKQGLDVYHLHHGIGARSLVADKLEQTRFTAGELNRRYIENSQNKNIRPVPTGLLKHQTILQKHSELRTELSKDTSSTVVLATQPYLDKVRSEFIDDVVDMLLTHTEYEIVIKPHPGEDTEYYDELIKLNYDETDRRRITVDKGQLYKKLYLADLTITISSNVAIESVILETPAITYNTWTPDIATPLYVEYGSIPKCESPPELRSLLQDTDPTDLMLEQKEILDREYMVYGNSVEQITGKIQAELVD
jgi:hypothetical protein